MKRVLLLGGITVLLLVGLTGWESVDIVYVEGCLIQCGWILLRTLDYSRQATVSYVSEIF